MDIRFDTQCSDGPSESDVLVFGTTQCSADGPSKDRKSRRKWSPKEDVVLINAWLNTSKDPTVVVSFWKRIASAYNSSPKLAGLQNREPTHCKQRWQKINDAVCKFVRCYEAATTQKSSDQNENDVMKLANQMFFNDHKAKFTLEHAWRELRHDPKWSSSKKTGTATKRRKCEDGSAQSSSSHPLSHGEDVEAMAAPPSAVKASNAKPKRNVTNNTSTVEEGEDKTLMRMWEIKQKDFAFQEKLSKHKLLDRLFAKTEPLSEMEMALKNKLINDMLSS